MNIKGVKTAERVSVEMSDNYVFARSVLAYRKAAELISGNILELGTGTGYGLQFLGATAKSLTSLDKINFEAEGVTVPDNVIIKQMKFPPFEGLENNSFDFVVSFQVIEHIKNHKLFLQEIKRVLKPGGKFIVTTPNKKASLTRNPFHVREYTPEQLQKLLLDCGFKNIAEYGVFGNDKIMQYYENNKKQVQKITRFDIFRFQWWLPRFLLQIPYDLANRLSRRRLLEEDTSLVSGITFNDYSIENLKESDNRTFFDLFYIAEA